MIPILYERDETAFRSNGLGRLADCIRCTVTEERNGIYECEFEYPVNGVNFDLIQKGRIIACTHDDQGDTQPFDIYAKSEPINGIVTFRAHHISYRQNEIVLKPFTAGSLSETILKLSSESLGINPFTFWTDKSMTKDFVLDRPKNIKQVLAGEQGSLLDVYGTGEYYYNRFEVRLYARRGTDTNIGIRYGKNLVDLTNDDSSEDSYTAVVPFWLGEVMDDTSEEAQAETVFVHAPNWIVYSSGTVPSGREVLVPMDLSNEFDDPPTPGELAALAQSKLQSSEAWLPNQTMKIDFVQLWQTEEYKQVAPLQRLRLCDTCGVFVPMYNISVRAKVIKTVYNVLLNRYDEMELGDKPTTYAAVLEKQYNSQVASFHEGFQALGVDLQVIKANSKKYTDNSIEELKDELEQQIDAKIETWAQATNPAAAWTTSQQRAEHKDDLWLYTGTSSITVGGVTIKPQGVYIYSGTSNTWSAYSSTTNNLFDLVDGKSTIFYGTPSGSYPGVQTGDYLVDKNSGKTYRWSGSQWVTELDYMTAINNAKQTIEQAYEAAIEHATDLITGGTGGYVITSLNAAGQPIELLITDNIDPAQAVNVWRWNKGGLGHSHSGYNGPFNDVAITQDGKINATMITTGTLTANIIRAGIISDINNINSWNLDTGVLAIQKGSINLGNGKFIATDAGKITVKGGGRIQDASNTNYWDLDNASLVAKKGEIGDMVLSNGTLKAYDSNNRQTMTLGSNNLWFGDLGNTSYTYIPATRLFRNGISFGPKVNGVQPQWLNTFATLKMYGYASSPQIIYLGLFFEDNQAEWMRFMDPTASSNPVAIYQNTYIGGKLSVSQDLTVQGTKSRRVDTKNYSERLLYCYETPTPIFGDIGEAVLDEDGICYVDIDDIFSETIADKVEYQVFLQKEGEGDCWIASKGPRYFVIKGTPNLKVAWELKAKQRDYQNIRLEQPDNGLEEYATVSDPTGDIESYIKEQEELLYG